MHINHFVTVIGADVYSNTLKCIDWFSRKTDIYDLPCSEFDGVFYLKKVISNPHYEYKDAIKELTKAYDKDDFIKNYQSFIKDLKQVSDVEEVFENKNPELCRLLIILREFKQYREGIMHHFLAIANNSRQNTIYGYLAEEFKNLYKQWAKLINVFLKACIRGNIKKYIDELIELVDVIAGDEKRVWDYCCRMI